MIRKSLSQDQVKRITFLFMGDYLYNDNLWLTEVQQKIQEITSDSKSVIVVGYKKDSSSYYLKMFPEWELFEYQFKSLADATLCREKYFTHDVGYVDFLPDPVRKYLEFFKSTETFKDLKDEFDHISKYREIWSGAPFPPIFVTIDAVVVKSGHVLVVRRKGNPGKGLIALPGGFLKDDEKIFDGCIRELKEETGIKVDKQDLRDAMIDSRVFDHPERSLRGRTITHAFCFDLKVGSLPQVKGMDDADRAWWMPLRDVQAQPDKFFEDHFHIITAFTARF